MSYSKLYFGKELSELSFEDVENFFVDEKEESDKIEFKSFIDKGIAADKLDYSTIIKNVCAMLNSEGGIIIWGAPIGSPHPSDNKRKIFKGELTLFSVDIEKDSFIRKVTNSITTSPNGILFQQISKSKNQHIYIIEVNKSQYSPHQFDNIYYMRLDGQTQKAPHHYIEALFKKITFPRLEGYLVIRSVQQFNNYHVRVAIEVFIFNQSKMLNDYDINCRIVIVGAEFVSQASTIKRQYISKGELILHKAKEIIYYGEPFIFDETVNVSMFPLYQPVPITIALFFGGKHSPLMLSEYQFLFKKGDNENFTVDEVSRNENQYFYELKEKIGISETDALNIILGR